VDHLPSRARTAPFRGQAESPSTIVPGAGTGSAWPNRQAVQTFSMARENSSGVKPGIVVIEP
jgi:hypothetical protein